MLGGLSFLNNQLTGAGVQQQPQQASMADIASALAGFSQVFAAGSNNPAMQALSQLALQRSQDMLALEYEQQLAEDPKVPPPPNLDPARAAAVTTRVAQRRMIELEERTQRRAEKQLEMQKEQFDTQMAQDRAQFDAELAVRKQQANADSLRAEAAYLQSTTTEGAKPTTAEEKLATVDALLEDYFGDPAAIVDPTIRTERQAMKSQLLQALDSGAQPGQLMQLMDSFWGPSYTNTFLSIQSGLAPDQKLDPAAVNQAHEARLVSEGYVAAQQPSWADKINPTTGLMPGEVGLAGVAMKAAQPAQPNQNAPRFMQDFYADTPLNAAAPMKFNKADLGTPPDPLDLLNPAQPANPQDLDWLSLLRR